MIELRNLIDFSQDYYKILGLSQNDLEGEDDKYDIRIIQSNALDEAYRKQARIVHPDMHPEEEQEKWSDEFRKLVRAHTVLSNPEWRAIYNSKDPTQLIQERFEIDLTQTGNYQSGTSMDLVGCSLFTILCERKLDLNIVPAFFPQERHHRYFWAFNIKKSDGTINTKEQLCISIIQDSEEILQLTAGDSIGVQSVPFKIYVYIPRDCLYLERDNEIIIRAVVNDYVLISTTNIQVATETLSTDIIEKFLADYRSGALSESYKAMDADRDGLSFVDKQTSDTILNHNLAHVYLSALLMKVHDQSAADFLDRISD